MKWEYLQVLLVTEGITTELDKLGDDRWELVAMHDRSAHDTPYRAP